MNLTRRRFLSIAAVLTAAPAHALTNASLHTWHGQAFGGEISLSLYASRDKAQAAFEQIQVIVRHIESLFSLYDPTSALSQLNRRGSLEMPTEFRELVEAADYAYHLTQGLFDPTVQPMWQAAATGRKPADVVEVIGWHKVGFTHSHINLATGQALTFNGIAQGYATDRVTDWLTTNGFERILVNIGEHRASGDVWTLGIEDPTHGIVGHRTLADRAIATSSPLATPVGLYGHIFNPQTAQPESRLIDDRLTDNHKIDSPRWSTVSVEAATATQADALSTGAVFAKESLLQKIRQSEGVYRITLIDQKGDVTTL